MVRDHFETFRAQAADLREGGGLPGFDERRSIGMAAGITRTPEGFLAGYADRRGAGTARGY